MNHSPKHIESQPKTAKANTPFFKPTIQKKLSVGSANDSYEVEADRVADKVMKMSEPSPHITHTGALVQRKCAHCEQEEKLRMKPLAESISPLIQRFSSESSGVAPDHVENQINSSKGGGNRMDHGTKTFMESRFGADFSDVKIHAGSEAVQMSRELNAQAFAVGNDIYFNEGKYSPNTDSGKHLLAHELTHTVQQSGGVGRKVQTYTEAERREMAERRVAGQPQDIAMATARSFQPGDIVFRLGSTALGFISGQQVTHGGIYIGNGLIHDAVGFGNRNVRVTNFYNPALGEAADTNTYRVIRFIGPHATSIIARLVQNINSGVFDMPTDSVPFNLFSGAGDYRTATCLEYAHAQILFAIRNLVLDPAVSDSDKTSLRSTYFRAGASRPSNLINPTTQRMMGNLPSLSPSSSIGSSGYGSSGFGSGSDRGLSSSILTGGLITAASALATDVDATRFRNRDESTYRVVYPRSGSSWGDEIVNAITGPLYDENVLSTFTYQSFVDSRQFFTVAASS